MRDTRLIMGMPVIVELVEPARQEDLVAVFEYFTAIDERFSTYKHDSEVMRFNRKEIETLSDEFREVLALADKTKQETDGYFDITLADGTFDPSGVVKGWAILGAANLLRSKGYEHFYLDVGGDIQTSGHDAEGKEWSIGIRNPFKYDEIVKVLYPRGAGVATSGTYVRGQHIYDPHARDKELTEVVSLTVLGPDVLEADRFATAAFAMGERGITFIEKIPTLEGYSIDARGVATYTSGFERFTRTRDTV